MVSKAIELAKKLKALAEQGSKYQKQINTNTTT